MSPSNVVLVVVLSIVVNPGNPGTPNCLILPCNCPSIASVIPGGNLPLSKLYNTIALGTLLVALTLNVDVKFALMLPKSFEVFHVIALSISPNNLTLNSLSFATVGLVVSVIRLL